MESREVALARELWSIEQQIDSAESAIKALKARYDAKATELQDYLVTEGKTSTGHIEGVGIFSIRRENYPSVSQARMPQFLDYVRAQGDAEMIVETVPAPTLKKYCKDKIEELTTAFIEDPDTCDRMSADLGITETLPPGEVAKKVLEQYGVQTFQVIKMGHTKKGK